MEKLKKSIALSLTLMLLLSLFPMNFSLGESVKKEDVLSEKVAIASTYPQNNAERVEINPVIKFDFTEPVELLDKSKIKISSNGGATKIDLDRDATVEVNDKLLKIVVNSENENKGSIMKANTEYRVTLEEGAIAFKDKIVNSSSKILNKEETLYFKTGKENVVDKLNDEKDLFVKKYSSNISGIDKINYINDTNLEKDKYIYIEFNKDIKWKNKKINEQDTVESFKLDDESNVINKDKSLEEIKIKSVEIVKNKESDKGKIIKIVLEKHNLPEKNLVNLNKYKLVLRDKSIITDINGKELYHNIEQNIWTKSSDDKEEPKIDTNYSAEKIKDDIYAPNKNSYVIEDSYAYSPLKPIVIYVDKHVVEKPKEQGNALSGIRLYEKTKDSLTKPKFEEIKKYTLEHFKINGESKTKISIYPNEPLKSLREYKLDIDNSTFVTRGNVPLKDTFFRYIIKDDGSETDIYETTIIVDGKAQTNEIFTDYLYFKKEDDNNRKPQRKHKISFEIKGHNLSEDIEKVEMIKIKDYELSEEETIVNKKPVKNQPISIPIKNIMFFSKNLIKGEFSEENLVELSNPSNLGTYKLKITFKDNKIIESSDNGNIIVTNRSCERTPIATGHFPAKGAINVDYNSLDTVEISFTDPYGDIVNLWNGVSSNNNGFSVTEANGTDVRDYSEPIAPPVRGVGIVTFKIPILKDLLQEGTRYRVEFPKSIVSCKNKFRAHENLEEKWEFTTKDRNLTNNVYEGSVPEDYYAEYPILLEHPWFSSNTSVYFKNVATNTEYKAESVTLGAHSSLDKRKLYVYLPKSPKLAVGLYDIVIKNGSFNETFKYGVFSVVKNGTNIPNEIDRDKDSVDSNIVNVKEIIKTSKNKMELKLNYTGRAINLDDVVGEEVLTREINFKGENLWLLSTKSKWADINLIGLKKSSSYYDMTIRLGQAEPQIQDIVKKKLKGYNIKSDFIVVGGENYSLNQINLTIPFKESSGKNLKLIRYDEESRRVDEITLKPSQINIKEKLVDVETNKKGIFVIVE